MAPRMLPITIPPTASPKPKSWSVLGRPQGRWLLLVCVVTSFALYFLWSPYYNNPLDRVLLQVPQLPLFEPQGPLPPSTLPLSPLSPTPPGPQVSIWEERKSEVRDAFVHALSGYMKYAFPHDELLSLTGGKTNKRVVSCVHGLSPLTYSDLASTDGVLHW
jgi:hypothetical protein